MNRIFCLALALLTTTTSITRGDEKAEARALVEKAVNAMGGKDKLAVGKASAFRLKGKFYGMGEGIDYTGEFAFQPPNQFRIKMDMEINAMKITVQMVYDGKKYWRKINDDTTELGKDDVAEAAEDMYAGRVEALVPLLDDKGYELATVGEVKVEDRPALGIRVSHRGHRDINLYFDKKSGLLVKSERAIKDQMQGGKERNQERLLSDYKEIGGAKRAMKVTIKRDGEKFVDSEMTEFEQRDKLDAAEFAKP